MSERRVSNSMVPVYVDHLCERGIRGIVRDWMKLHTVSE